MFDDIKTGVNDIHDKEDRLMRCEGWTTNGYWLIRSELEPTALKKRASNFEIDIDRVTRTLFYAQENPLTAIEPMRVFTKQFHELPICEFKGSKAGMNIYANAHFVKMFLKAGADNFAVDNSKRMMPIIAMKRLWVMGCIMPLNISE